jgi:uridine kinase
MLNIKCPDGKIHQYAPGTKITAIAPEFADRYATPIAEAIINGRRVGLSFELEEDCTLDFIELYSIAGNRVYVRTLFFAFVTAMSIKRPEVQIELQNSLGSAIYCKVKNGIVLSKYDLEDVNKTLQEMIARKEPVQLKWLTVEKAKKLVKPFLTKDTLPLLEVADNLSKVPIYKLKSEWAFFLGNMLPDLGYIKGYKLFNYKAGVLISYPTGPDYNVVPEFVDQPKLSAVYDAAEELGKRINCTTVASLNKFIKDGNSRGIIQISEARHEKEIARDC